MKRLKTNAQEDLLDVIKRIEGNENLKDVAEIYGLSSPGLSARLFKVDTLKKQGLFESYVERGFLGLSKPDVATLRRGGILSANDFFNKRLRYKSLHLCGFSTKGIERVFLKFGVKFDKNKSTEQILPVDIDGISNMRNKTKQTEVNMSKETKFTGGEWFINKIYSTMLQIDSDKGSVCVVDTDAFFNECEINPSNEQLANAHLIKTAPKLYAMLETLLGNYQVAASIAEHEGYETNYEQDKILSEFLLAETRGEL